jgi:DNA-binding response OmpR family regulator
MNRKILLVEDDPDALHCYEDYFLKKGFAVDTATHGKAALQVFRKICPACVIMDIVLPGQGGVESAAEIRRSPAGDVTAVILITGVYRNVRNRLEAYRRSGADACLFKPFPLSELHDAVERALEKREEGVPPVPGPGRPASPGGGPHGEKPGGADYLNGRRLFRAGLYRAARQCFTAALSVRKDPRYFFHLARAVERARGRGWLREAISGYRAALALDPYHAPSYFRLGRLYHLQAREKKAADNYRLALALKPDYNEAARALKKLLGASVKKKKRVNFFP